VARVWTEQPLGEVERIETVSRRGPGAWLALRLGPVALAG
jgi:hypothetical protein